MDQAKEWLDAGYVLVPQHKHKGVQAYGTWPDEVPVLALITDMHKGGSTLAAISDALRDRGHIKRNGKPWTRADVWGIVSRR